MFPDERPDPAAIALALLVVAIALAVVAALVGFSS